MFYQSNTSFYAACLSNGFLNRKHVVRAEKKKLKNLRKFRDSHRSLARKTIDSAAELIAGENAIDIKKLKLLRTTLEAKLSELQALDRDIVELLEDVSKIDQDVAESCELSSAIRECIVNLEAVFSAEEAQRKSQEFASTNQSVSNSGGVGISQKKPSKVTTHAKLPKLELRNFHGNPIDWYPFWESFESAVHKNPNLS